MSIVWNSAFASRGHGLRPLTYAERCYTVCITVRFEWDSKKNRTNQTKHAGLDLKPQLACSTIRVWSLSRTALSTANSDGTRLAPFQRLFCWSCMYTVRTTVNGEEIIRIISAREANQRERRIYIQQAAE